MSWILGCVGIPNQAFFSKVEAISSSTIFRFQKNRISILSGGNNNTNLFQIQDKKNQFNWAIVGMGFSEDGESYNLLCKNDWSIVLNEKRTEKVFGHFVAVTWDNNELKIITDQQGIRDIHYSLSENSLYFSTRADWLAKIIKADINFREFGSRWLLVNHIGIKSILPKLERSTLGASLKFNFKLQKIDTTQTCIYTPPPHKRQIKNPI